MRAWRNCLETPPNLRMSDMRLGRLLHGDDGDHSAYTLSGRVAHMSPSSSGAEVQ